MVIVNGLHWRFDFAEEEMSFGKAIEAVDSLRKEENGWRLPTTHELNKARKGGVGIRDGMFWTPTVHMGEIYLKSFVAGSYFNTTQQYEDEGYGITAKVMPVRTLP
jgi:hypothetical protein